MEHFRTPLFCTSRLAILPILAIMLGGCFNALRLPKFSEMDVSPEDRERVEELAAKETINDPFENDHKDPGYEQFASANKKSLSEYAALGSGQADTPPGEERDHPIDYLLTLDPSRGSGNKLFFSSVQKMKTPNGSAFVIGDSVGVHQNTYSDGQTTVGGVFPLNGTRFVRKNGSEEGVDNIFIDKIGHWQHFMQKLRAIKGKEDIISWELPKDKDPDVRKAKLYVYDKTYGRMGKHIGDIFKKKFAGKSQDYINEHTKVVILDGFDIFQIGNFTGLLGGNGMRQFFANKGITKNVTVEGDFNWFNIRQKLIAKQIYDFKKRFAEQGEECAVFVLSMSSSCFKAEGISFEEDKLVEKYGPIVVKRPQIIAAPISSTQPATGGSTTIVDTLHPAGVSNIQKPSGTISPKIQIQQEIEVPQKSESEKLSWPPRNLKDFTAPPPLSTTAPRNRTAEEVYGTPDPKPTSQPAASSGEKTQVSEVFLGLDKLNKASACSTGQCARPTSTSGHSSKPIN